MLAFLIPHLKFYYDNYNGLQLQIRFFLNGICIYYSRSFACYFNWLFHAGDKSQKIFNGGWKTALRYVAPFTTYIRSPLALTYENNNPRLITQWRHFISIVLRIIRQLRDGINPIQVSDAMGRREIIRIRIWFTSVIFRRAPRHNLTPMHHMRLQWEYILARVLALLNTCFRGFIRRPGG